MSYSFGAISLSRAPALPLSPDGDSEDVVIRTPSDAGYVQTRPRFTRARRSWGLVIHNLTNADITALRTYEITTLHNGADSFTFNHPVSGTFTVQLAGPIKYSRNQRHDRTDVSISLQEV